MFKICSYKKRFDANKVNVLEKGIHPYVVRMSGNNGQKGYIDENPIYLNEGNTISFGQDTATMFYQKTPYFTGDKIKILKPKYKNFNKNNAQFILSALRKSFSLFSWGGSSFNVDIISEQLVKLPIKNNEIDFEFMESFVAELEAQRVAELEAYLMASGLDDYELTLDEINTLNWFDKVEWGKFNLKDLFGNATRGKRLKSADRVDGNLPFVTAGETDEGISAYIGNQVEVFGRNTTTIDMFGSAKYRNYKYGADDHVSVVHTENIPKLASIFITSAIHKASHTGEFNYGKNFYAKDADDLNIMLPIKDEMPNYDYMETIISYVQKIVVKDVVDYADNKIEKTKQVINYK